MNLRLHKARIWILESDATIQAQLEALLRGLFRVDFFEDLASMKDSLENASTGQRPALLIVDLTVRDGMFLDLVVSEEWQQKYSHVPFIVISQVNRIETLRDCFQKGAIDYLTKPISNSELLVKIERIIDKQKVGKPGSDLPILKLDPTTFTLIKGTKVSPVLTAKEYRIVAMIMESSDFRVHKNNLLDRVWGSVGTASRNSLDVYYYHLRQKLEAIDIEFCYQSPFYFLR